MKRLWCDTDWSLFISACADVKRLKAFMIRSTLMLVSWCGIALEKRWLRGTAALRAFLQCTHSPLQQPLHTNDMSHKDSPCLARD